MKQFKIKQLNVYEDFLKQFTHCDLVDILIWIKAVIKPHIKEKFLIYSDEVFMIVDEAIKGNQNIQNAKEYAQKLHKVAKTLKNDDQFYIQALAHAVSSTHIKTRALVVSKYILQLVQFQSKDSDTIIGERMRHIVLLNHDVSPTENE